MQISRQRSPSSRSANPVLEFIARYGIIFVLILMVVALAILTPWRRGEQYFLTERNLLNVALQASINAVIAVGMTFIITSGGIDLSVGSMAGFAGVITAIALRDYGVGYIGGFLVAVGTGAACGLFNGLLITRVNLQPFIATLGTMGIFRGLALVASNGRPIYGFNHRFIATFSGETFFNIPKPVIVAAVVAVAGWLVLTQTRFGKYTIAIGGNEETTGLAGIPVRRYKLGIYALGGLLTGISAALLTARLSSADPIAGNLFELDAIAATVMGGTSLTGGEGTILGTIVGALIISLVRNGMNILNVPSFWQQFVIGSVIILAVMLDQWRKKQVHPQ
jgi:ribose/xylose/arabinose/galactoside ABC-type transport system permease subunit